MLPRIVDLVGDQDIPVIASGGIVDARGYVAALALGAQGVCLGTRSEIFLSHEAFTYESNYLHNLRYMLAYKLVVSTNLAMQFLCPKLIMKPLVIPHFFLSLFF